MSMMRAMEILEERVVAAADLIAGLRKKMADLEQALVKAMAKAGARA